MVKAVKKGGEGEGEAPVLHRQGAPSRRHSDLHSIPYSWKCDNQK